MLDGALPYPREWVLGTVLDSPEIKVELDEGAT
jgi:hypothetical protein